jgi:hypothetical protein
VTTFGARLWRRQLALKLQIELASRDVRLVAFALTGLAVIRAWEQGHNDTTSVAPSVVTLFLALAPAGAGTMAALSSSRDTGAGLLRYIRPTRGLSGWWAHAAATEVLALSVTAGSFLVAVVPVALTASRDAGATGEPHRLLAVLIGVVLWAGIGMAAGAITGSRPAAVAVVVGMLVANAAIERIAITVPMFRWLYALSPNGIADIAADGASSVAVPARVASMTVAVAFGCWVAAPLAIAASRVRKRPRARARRPSKQALWLALGFSIVIGAASGPALQAVLPWRLSPVWIVDVLNGNTPETAVRRLVADPHRASVLGPVAESMPTDAKKVAFDTPLSAPHAGRVDLRWRAADGKDYVLAACTRREAERWRVVELRRLGVCP